ncbi:putative SAM-dependent methyltransferase [Desulfosporosinus acidiphilus SJ4]|uniref:Putative SAM-dependent methyltransferase n=1 Tax=Desulfosporosinus acidiphilus (strain DSM 22704 / JCM 16185 / SJ4) TaxID=646529 RepID=I4DAC7_DESAJ|nr:class I SAM-dependent methyltransferase [Desulfosporosinus acidiphilus]AFM42751.1 putative SAM-dependent methyltransferase [Desulfosporosinus acidiphilus SJ4]
MTFSLTLGPRLQSVASLVPLGARLGDIGTDHAYLPIALVEGRKITQAVAVDVHEGPFQSALAAVKLRRLEEVIDVRFGDGLKPLKAGEVDVLTLAGMGGKTMLEIFKARPEVLDFVTDLIVQPQGGEGAVRLSLLNSRWLLKTEQLIKEEERIYTVMAFSREEGCNLADLTLMKDVWYQRLSSRILEGTRSAEYQTIIDKLVWHFGPLILEEHSNLLQENLADYCVMLKRRLEQMKQSNKSETLERIKEVSEELALVEGIIEWQ